MRCVRVLVTTNAPAFANACSIARPPRIERGERDGARQWRAALADGQIADRAVRGDCSRPRTTSRSALPALVAEAATAVTSNQG